VLRGGGVEIDLDSADVEKSLKIGDLSGDLFAGFRGEDWWSRITNRGRRFDADNSDQGRGRGEAEGLKARSDGELPGGRLKSDGLGEKSDSDWLALQEEEVFGALPSPENNSREVDESRRRCGIAGEGSR
jgi:hypothetical protein